MVAAFLPLPGQWRRRWGGTCGRIVCVHREPRGHSSMAVGMPDESPRCHFYLDSFEFVVILSTLYRHKVQFELERSATSLKLHTTLARTPLQVQGECFNASRKRRLSISVNPFIAFQYRCGEITIMQIGDDGILMRSW